MDTAQRIITKSNLVKLFLENILLEVNMSQETTITQRDLADIRRAIDSCTELADLGKTVKEMINDSRQAIR